MPSGKIKPLMVSAISRTRVSLWPVDHSSSCRGWLDHTLCIVVETRRLKAPPLPVWQKLHRTVNEEHVGCGLPCIRIVPRQIFVILKSLIFDSSKFSITSTAR